MAGEIDSVPFDINWFMREEEVSDHLSRKHVNAVTAILQLAKDVVVAANELKPATREMTDNLAKHFPVVVVATVEEVAEEIGCRRFQPSDQVNKPFGIALIGPQWHRQPGTAKVIHLSEVEIGHDQGLQPGHPQGSIDEQLNGMFA